MPNMNSMFPSKYLKADDLKAPSGKGFREFALSIASIDLEDFNGDNGTEKKWVLHFRGADKGLVLNRTNAQTISDSYGDNTDMWMNEKVVLYVITVGTPQGPKPGIRVRVPSAETFSPPEGPAPVMMSTPVMPDFDPDEIPF